MQRVDERQQEIDNERQEFEKKQLEKELAHDLETAKLDKIRQEKETDMLEREEEVAKRQKEILQTITDTLNYKAIIDKIKELAPDVLNEAYHQIK